MVDDFKDIEQIERFMTIESFCDYFSELESNAFKLRGRSSDFYSYVKKYFDENEFKNEITVLLLKYLVSHKGNWKHDFLSGMYEKYNKPLEKQKFKIDAIHYALTYIFECSVKGIKAPIGKKKELEEIGNKITDKKDGNTFYKCINDTTKKDLNKQKDLIELGGENWREIILQLSTIPEEVSNYLKDKGL